MDRCDIHRHWPGVQSWSPTQTVCVACVPQFQYWEPCKWVAKLRALKTDDNLLVFRTRMDAGHGGASGRYEGYREQAEECAFMLKAVGFGD